MKHKRIIVGLSGGVDSAVAAQLLLEQGHQVEALFMKNWEEDDTDAYCSANEDLQDAEIICDLLQIPLHTVNFSSEYWDQVFEYFLAEHRVGRTPNPDILCNTKIKFHHFFDHAKALGADLIATGHYVRSKQIGQQTALCTSKDTNKDQTYFLHGLSQSQLSSSIFPLGDFTKSEVRTIAQTLQLPVFDKKDSTGICFIGERRFDQFLQRYIQPNPGEIVDVNDNVVGQHNGATFYTIGQRQGLGIGGQKGSNNQPWYVVDKDMKSNKVVVVQGADHARLYHRVAITGPVHWIRNAPASQTLSAKIRYRQNAQFCSIQEEPNGGLRVEFTQPQRAVTPGQFIVFYCEDECLGGAAINQRQT